MVALLIERVRQRTHAVGRVRHAVQQQHAPDRCRVGQFKAMVPVVLPVLRIGSTALAVAFQTIGTTGLRIRIDLLFQLPEQKLIKG